MALRYDAKTGKFVDDSKVGSTLFQGMTNLSPTVSPTTSTQQYSSPIGPAPLPTKTSIPAPPPAQTGLTFTVDGKTYYSASGNRTDAVLVPPKTETTPIPTKTTETPKLTGDDFKSFYGDVDTTAAKAELDAARQQEQQAFESSQKQIQGLIDSSQKMFNDLYNSPEMQQAKQGQAQAFTELSRLDAEQQQATFNLKQAINQKGTPSWAAAGQLRIVAEGYNAQKAGYLATLAISNNALEQGYKYAEQAYNANLNTLNAKIGLVENALSRAKELTAQEKSDYEDVLTRAKELAEQQKSEKDLALQTYLQLTQQGVAGITPTMSLEQMILAASPEIAKMAQEDRALAISQAKASIAKTISTGTGTGTDQLYSGLSTATATAVRSQVTKFASQPIAQNFATIQEGYNFASSLSNTTQNPVDDQGLIYSLAKALDPGSVVREGEYATAQKYAQSWVSAFGKSVTQAILGTGFLSEEARANIKKTIQSKYEASKTSYDNLYNQYEGSINNLTGRTDGSSFLVDFTTPAGGASTGNFTEEDVRFTVQQEASKYNYDGGREALLAALIAKGVPQDLASLVVYSTIKG